MQDTLQLLISLYHDKIGLEVWLEMVTCNY